MIFLICLFHNNRDNTPKMSNQKKLIPMMNNESFIEYLFCKIAIGAYLKYMKGVNLIIDDKTAG